MSFDERGIKRSNDPDRSNNPEDNFGKFQDDQLDYHGHNVKPNISSSNSGETTYNGDHNHTNWLTYNQNSGRKWNTHGINKMYSGSSGEEEKWDSNEDNKHIHNYSISDSGSSKGSLPNNISLLICIKY